MSNRERELGDLLKDARIKKGWTVRHVAGIVGISASYLSNIENGRTKKPSYSTLLALSNCYDTDLIKLLSLGIYSKKEIENTNINIELLNLLKIYSLSELEFIGVGLNDLVLLSKYLLPLQRVELLIEREGLIEKDGNDLFFSISLFSNEELINELKKRGLLKERVSCELDVEQC